MPWLPRLRASSAPPLSRGNAGVYVFQVVKKQMRPAKYNEEQQIQMCRQRAMQYMGNFMQDLVFGAGVVDNRYLFF